MPEAPPARPDRSMSLLLDVMGNSLDSDYRNAAQRRGEQPPAVPERDRPSRRRGVLPLLVLLGLLSGTAAAQVRSRSAELDEVRVELAAEVVQRTRESDALAARVAALRAEVRALQAAELGGDGAGGEAAEQLASLELAAGVVPVTGPGLVVRLDDAPAETAQEIEARGGEPGEGRVLDRDLQDAVNGLWAAGAEAISVNDLRLTARTAIRSAGEAVLVDFRPISPPYVIRAVGDPERLEQRFTEGPSGQRLASYTDLYGISLEVEQAERLRLPAAGVPALEQTR